CAGNASGLLQRSAPRREHVVAVDAKAVLEQVPGHGRAHDAQADDADWLHFFFFFLTDFFFEKTRSGFEFTRIAAMMHGSLPRTLQEWLVPRWMSTSPARSSVSPLSMMA